MPRTGEAGGARERPPGGGSRRPRRAGDGDRVAAILRLLDERWPEATTELAWRTPFELLVATVLSAQCTDERVNRVTPEVFARWPDAPAMATADPGELEAVVRPTGFFRSKARHLRAAAAALVERHGGEVPATMEELTALPGVARKTANVVLGTALGVAAGITVDTHVARVSRRLGLTSQEDPERIERDLTAAVPPSRWIRFGHQLVLHGRYVCTARRPACGSCPLAPHCPAAFTFETR